MGIADGNSAQSIVPPSGFCRKSSKATAVSAGGALNRFESREIGRWEMGDGSEEKRRARPCQRKWATRRLEARKKASEAREMSPTARHLFLPVQAWLPGNPPARIGCAPGKVARAHRLNQGGAQGDQGYGGDKWSCRASPRDR